MALNTVGVNELKTEFNWTLYPNPTQNVIHFKGLNSNEIQNIKIIDLNGKVCGNYTFSESIDITFLPKGIYILRIVINNRVEQQKFVKI